MSTPVSESFSEDLLRHGTDSGEEDAPLLVGSGATPLHALLRVDDAVHRLVPPIVPDPPQEVTACRPAIARQTTLHILDLAMLWAELHK